MRSIMGDSRPAPAQGNHGLSISSPWEHWTWIPIPEDFCSFVWKWLAFGFLPQQIQIIALSSISSYQWLDNSPDFKNVTLLSAVFFLSLWGFFFFFPLISLLSLLCEASGGNRHLHSTLYYQNLWCIHKWHFIMSGIHIFFFPSHKSISPFQFNAKVSEKTRLICNTTLRRYLLCVLRKSFL